VGSHARGSASAESDVDLVILAHEPQRYLLERDWVLTFGTPRHEAVEDYGNLQSVRVHYEDDLEVEFGFTSIEWAGLPLDSGTRDVIEGGMQVILERGPILSRLFP
jgi:predicted nucleotidyltransferase